MNIKKGKRTGSRPNPNVRGNSRLGSPGAGELANSGGGGAGAGVPDDFSWSAEPGLARAPSLDTPRYSVKNQIKAARPLH